MYLQHISIDGVKIWAIGYSEYQSDLMLCLEV